MTVENDKAAPRVSFPLEPNSPTAPLAAACRPPMAADGRGGVDGRRRSEDPNAPAGPSIPFITLLFVVLVPLQCGSGANAKFGKLEQIAAGKRNLLAGVNCFIVRKNMP